MIDIGNCAFAPFEFAIGLQQVIDGRHEIAVLHSTGQIARKSRKKTQLPLSVTHYQHTQHLARVQFGSPLTSALHITHHMRRGSLAKRVRNIAKRESELCRERIRLQHFVQLPVLKPVNHFMKNYRL